MPLDDSFYDNVEGLERYLNLPKDALRNIPIYARKAAVDAILKVQKMESSSLFRPGLYYIVLADLCGNTAFNARYGDAEGNVRTEWFHTVAIQTLGQLDLRNYVTFSKTIGDAALFIFSSFLDVFDWSELFTKNLDGMEQEYVENLEKRGVDYDEDKLDEQVEAFKLRARRLVHLGEVSYSGGTDPLSLAVSQTFKIEKNFAETELGCTQAVADAIRPTIDGLQLELSENVAVALPGSEKKTMTYYVRRKLNK